MSDRVKHIRIETNHGIEYQLDPAVSATVSKRADPLRAGMIEIPESAIPADLEFGSEARIRADHMELTAEREIRRVERHHRRNGAVPTRWYLLEADDDRYDSRRERDRERRRIEP